MACAEPVYEDVQFPTNIWRVISDVGCDWLTYNAKTKRTFNAVLFEIRNFRSWFEDSLCKEIMDTMFQMQQEDKGDDADDKAAFFVTLKHAVVR